MLESVAEFVGSWSRAAVNALHLLAALGCSGILQTVVLTGCVCPLPDGSRHGWISSSAPSAGAHVGHVPVTLLQAALGCLAVPRVAWDWVTQAPVCSDMTSISEPHGWSQQS